MLWFRKANQKGPAKELQLIEKLLVYVMASAHFCTKYRVVLIL
jgi:hypothetical protein